MVEHTNTHVVFIHLDLGIGGAESLILNLAKATLPDDDDDDDVSNRRCSSSSSSSSSSYYGSISIYTTHCSPTHCYDEVKPPDGRLASFVHVRGSWIPRNIYCFGGTALCSALRMLYLTYIAARENPLANVFVIDVLPTGVPYLAECCHVNAGVLFYCHFPDKLLTRDTVNGEGQLVRNETMIPTSSSSSSRLVKYLRWLKRFYRWVMDTVEEWSMSYSDLIVVNSMFTRGEVEKVFSSLFSSSSASSSSSRGNTNNVIIMEEEPTNSHNLALYGERVRVLYPSIESSLSRQRRNRMMNPIIDNDRTNDDDDDDNHETNATSSLGPIVSLNRFERKKNIALVLHAYDVLLDRSIHNNQDPNSTALLLLPPLIIAGGYDPLNVENVEYFCELRKLADAILDRYNLPKSVVCSSSKSSSVVDGVLDGSRTRSQCILFLPSVSDAKRTALLTVASVCCYTPHREHSGIVPLEAMDAGVPVVAIRSGGPVETIVDGVTGYLVDYSADDARGAPREHPTVVGFTNGIYNILSNPSLAKVMGQRGRERVDETFGMETFRRQWWELLLEARERGSRRCRTSFVSYPSLLWSSIRTVRDFGWTILLAIFLTWALKHFGE